MQQQYPQQTQRHIQIDETKITAMQQLHFIINFCIIVFCIQILLKFFFALCSTDELYLPTCLVIPLINRSGEFSSRVIKRPGDLSGVEWEPFRGELQQELSAVTPSQKKKIDRKPNTDFLMILLLVRFRRIPQFFRM